MAEPGVPYYRVWPCTYVGCTSIYPLLADLMEHAKDAHGDASGFFCPICMRYVVTLVVLLLVVIAASC